jgi:hypothetical protein
MRSMILAMMCLTMVALVGLAAATPAGAVAMSNDRTTTNGIAVPQGVTLN